MMDLLPQHQKLIEASAIDPAVASARGYRSVVIKADLRRLGFADYQCRVPALLIPVFSVHGEIATYQLRPDEPRVDRKKGKALKYETLAGRRVFIDVHPEARKGIGNPNRPLFVTEGVRKADAAESKGLCCIDILGVWNWRGTNEQGGKVALPDWELVALKDRKVYIVFDSDVTEKREVHGALVRMKTFLGSRGADVRIIYLPHSGGGGKLGLDDYLALGKSVEDLLALASPDLREPAHDELSGDPVPYSETQKGLVWFRTTHDGIEVPVPLTNFCAKITADISRDDGLEAQHVFVLEAHRGERECRFEIPASSFASMNWATEKLGATAILYPGMGIRDHARAAIQILSGEVPERQVFVHCGWRQLGDAWVYLHGGGAIGTFGTFPGVEVELEQSLEGLVLPPPPEGEALRDAVRASLELRHLGKPEIIDPVLCLVYRAPLASMAPLDFSGGLTGPTGVFKTEIAALAQGHFGAAFNGRTLPGSWKSTANSLERLLFVAKDALVAVDDFAPGGTAADISRNHREADNLLRGVGNRSGRGRLRPDGTARPTYRPRGATLSTGEDVPRGHSLRVRMLILEVSPGDVDVQELSKAQALRDAGLYASAMSGYIRWLASRIDPLKGELSKLRTDLRSRASQDGLRHRRVPDITASLFCGFLIFLRFAEDCGAVSEREEKDLLDAVWASLGQAASRQADFHSAEDPTTRFLQLLAGALASGRAHLASANGAEEPSHPERCGWRGRMSERQDDTEVQWYPLGTRIGWVSTENILLEPEAAFAEVQELAREQGTSIPVGQRTLWKRLAEKGLLASTDTERRRNVVRMTIDGERREVIHLQASTLWPTHPPENVPNVPNVPVPRIPAELGRFPVGRKPALSEKTAQGNGPKTAQGRAIGPIGTIGTFSGGIAQDGEWEEGVL